MHQPPHILTRADNSLRKQETGSEVFIVSRRSHRHNQRFFSDPNFQRLFHNQLVGDAFDGTIRLTAKNAAGPNPTRFNFPVVRHPIMVISFCVQIAHLEDEV